MTSNAPKKKPKMSPFSYHFEDGLLDVFVGVILLQQGMTILFTQLNLFGDASALAAFLMCFLFYIGIILLWKRMTLPRISKAVTTPIKKKNFTFFFIFSGVFFILMIIGAVLFSQTIARASLFRQLLIRVLPMILALGIGAYLLEISRMFLYAAAVVFAFPFGGYLSVLIGWVYIQPVLILMTALVIILVGIVFFIRFIRTNKS